MSLFNAFCFQYHSKSRPKSSEALRGSPCIKIYWKHLYNDQGLQGPLPNREFDSGKFIFRGLVLVALNRHSFFHHPKVINPLIKLLLRHWRVHPGLVRSGILDYFFDGFESRHGL